MKGPPEAALSRALTVENALTGGGLGGFVGGAVFWLIAGQLDLKLYAVLSDPERTGVKLNAEKRSELTPAAAQTMRAVDRALGRATDELDAARDAELIAGHAGNAEAIKEIAAELGQPHRRIIIAAADRSLPGWVDPVATGVAAVAAIPFLILLEGLSEGTRSHREDSSPRPP